MVTMAARGTNIAALATGHNHCTFIHSIASVRYNAFFKVFSGSALSLAKTTILQFTAVLAIYPANDSSPGI